MSKAREGGMGRKIKGGVRGVGESRGQNGEKTKGGCGGRRRGGGGGA